MPQSATISATRCPSAGTRLWWALSERLFMAYLKRVRLTSLPAAVAPGASKQQLMEIKPGDSSIYQQPNDWFGYAVSISGDTLVVGTPAKNSDTGTAYVFTRSGSAWSLQTALNPLDVTSIFGYSVSLSGSTAVIGSPGTGAAYVFTGSGANWSQQAKLNSSDVPGGDDFGHSVSLSGDTVVVGADFNNSNTGAAYVFTRSGVTWSQQQKLTAADAASSDYCGSAVSISGDTAVIGASGKDTSRGACLYLCAQRYHLESTN